MTEPVPRRIRTRAEARTHPMAHPIGVVSRKGGIGDQPRAAEGDTPGIPSYVGAALDAATTTR